MIEVGSFIDKRLPSLGITGRPGSPDETTRTTCCSAAVQGY